jgi:hypothetical protein
MIGANDDLFHALRELDTKARNALGWEQKGFWIGGAFLACIAYFKPDQLMAYLGFGCLWQLYRIGCQMDYAHIHQERNEAILQTIRRKLTEIKPDERF